MDWWGDGWMNIWMYDGWMDGLDCMYVWMDGLMNE